MEEKVQPKVISGQAEGAGMGYWLDGKLTGLGCLGRATHILTSPAHEKHHSDACSHSRRPQTPHTHTGQRICFPQNLLLKAGPG